MSGESEFNPEQRRAIEHGDGPLMVLAGAGSGKTRVLVHRIARLVERGVPPATILAVTFSNKAAGEMRERLRGLLGPIVGAMWVGTFHATCARLLRHYHARVGLSRDFVIFDDDDQMKLVGALLKQHGLDEAVTPRTVLSAIDRAKNRGDAPAKASYGHTYTADLVAQIFPAYQASLAREDAVDFNDLLLKVLELCRDPEVGPELAARFRHVLVDEFQDTNLVQYRLVRHLSSATGNLTVVGDDDQAIYGWRGAEPKNLLEFDRDFVDAAVVKLEQNYRSSQIILTAANAVIAENVDRHAKALWTERDGGEPILWEEAQDERAEAEFVARAIRGLVTQEGREHGDVAVLYRTHAQSRVLEEMLRMYRIGYRIVGGLSFFQRREIKDVRAYLRLLVNPASDTCFERVVNVPARGIGKTSIDHVRAHARAAELGLLDAARGAVRGSVLALKPAARRRLAGFVDMIDGLAKVHAAGASVAELIIQTVERTGYRERLEQEDTVEARERLANLSELVTMAADFDDEAEGKGSLTEFEERISLASALDEADGRGSEVSLMTIHAAKGLEFPVVFVCGMEDGLFPSLRQREEGNERQSLEEERRLAYVAFTRAKDRLILSNARMRRQWAEVKVNPPSRFLDHIPRECLAVRERPEPRSRALPPSLAQRASSRQVGYDEHDQRDAWDDVPVFAVEPEPARGFSVGSLVRHVSFGRGRVVERRGAGADEKLLIDFATVGLKTVLARFVSPN